MVEQRLIVQSQRQIGVVRAQAGLIKHHGPGIEGHGIHVIAFETVHFSQIGEALRKTVGFELLRRIDCRRQGLDGCRIASLAKRPEACFLVHDPGLFAFAEKLNQEKPVVERREGAHFSRSQSLDRLLELTSEIAHGNGAHIAARCPRGIHGVLLCQSLDRYAASDSVPDFPSRGFRVDNDDP